MGIKYDNYVYKLVSVDPALTITLPKDLLWPDELTWGKVAQYVEWSTTGALLIQEGVKLKGRNITLQGIQDMAWISRSQADDLALLRDTPGLQMSLSFVDKDNPSNVKFTKNVMFRHADGAFNITPVKQWDQFEKEEVVGNEHYFDSWYIVNSINLMEV